MEQPLLSNPNISTTPCGSSTTNSPTAESSPAPSTTLTGLAFVVILASLSVWANLEAGKGFDISILNAAPAGTLAARRFDLLFVSNGRAARILLNASESVERILYPNELYPRKPVRSVTLRLASHDLSEAVTLSHGDDPHLPGDFVIHVSPSVIAEADPGSALASAVQRAMSRVWLWDGGGVAPKWLVDAMVEYLSSSAGFASDDAVPLRSGGSCWGEEDPASVARFFKYCEERRRGFVARLNRAMRKHWNEMMVDVALGSSSQRLCLAYLTRPRQRGEVSGSTRSVLGLSQAM
ncbi:uncharacterized protein [Elaeis guineensis]|uniref:Uncharacterized protein LOC105032181 n=1 Tax=Elaeis guineensis var. tenera TaxID=51953 RepID=A0A6I9Q7X4_ELAGV|nr:uncharacterized protein LOC105032181 [Elaeis guineensis]